MMASQSPPEQYAVLPFPYIFDFADISLESLIPPDAFHLRCTQLPYTSTLSEVGIDYAVSERFCVS